MTTLVDRPLTPSALPQRPPLTPRTQSSILKSAYKYQSELETSLTLARSNLKMSQANSELLEDALRRDAARRLDTPQSATPTGSAVGSPNPGTGVASPIPADGVVSPVASSAASEHRESHGLFGFKIPGSGNSHAPSPPVGRSSTPGPPPAQGVAAIRGSHVASASMPSLLADPVLKRVEELNKTLEAEREALKKARQEKTDLEAELESLSQALFEEVPVSALSAECCNNVYSP
jgi:hypothetical protein